MKVGIWGGGIPFYKKRGIDVFAQLEHLKNLGANIYCHIIYKNEDVEQLHQLLDTLEAPFWSTLKNLEVWPVLLPPTENGSEPYGFDWRRWAKVFKALHMLYPRLSAVVIDDFNWFNPSETFQNAALDNLRIWRLESQIQYLNAFYEILTSEGIKFYPVIYETKLVAEEDRFQAFIDFVKDWVGHAFHFDGMIGPWMNLCSVEGLQQSLARVRTAFPKKTLIGMVYASDTSWHRYPPPLPAYIQATKITHDNSDMLVNYCVPSKGSIFEATKTIFKKWGDDQRK